MLHIHFGAGRLGLGLIAPAFKTDASELYLLNRATSGAKATGQTSLSAGRRNALLGAEERKRYFIEKPGGSAADRRTVTFDEFVTYDGGSLQQAIEGIANRSRGAKAGVVVSASVLAIENYPPVIEALNLLASRRAQGGGIGPIYFVACENTLSAPAVFGDETVRPSICREAFEHVTCVHALVDRMCVGLEEVMAEDGPAVLVRAEDYGSVKLELGPDSRDLVELCRGSEVEFSRHVDTEKQIRSWLLNGTHWLIALEAFEKSRGDEGMKLNEFLLSDPRHMAFAEEAMGRCRKALPSSSATTAASGLSSRRSMPTATWTGPRRPSSAGSAPPRTRSRASWPASAPTPDSLNTIVSFSKRFADRVDEPMQAYEAENGVLPPAASRGALSLMRLVATGTFITASA